MKETYDDAIAAVFKDEGGYSNVPGDHGGPTNWGITIWDARKYWKPDATAADVKSMPKSVAAQIYREHYANPIGYDSLPAGVDYAVLDYVVNSGLGKAAQCKGKTVDQIYDQREAFLRAISQHPGQAKFLPGWMNRTRRGRALAKRLQTQYGKGKIPVAHTTAGGVVAGGAVAASQFPHWAIYIIPAAVLVAIGAFFIIKSKEK